MLLLIYIISATAVLLFLSWEWIQGREIGYNFGIESYLSALALITIPVINTIFMCYLIFEYTADAYNNIFNE